MRRETPQKIRDRQRGLYLKAKREPPCRFSLRHDKVWREDILAHAYRLGRANGGAPGLEGVTVQSIESGEGAAQVLAKLQPELKEKTYRPQPGRRVYLPKGAGKQRPLGIPTLRDRGAQRAVKLVMEPILAADFADCSSGVRPTRDAQQAVGAIREALSKGQPSVFAAARPPYCDTLPPAALRKGRAGRMSDRHSRRWLKQGLKATVVEETAEGKRRATGGKTAKRGTPQGGVLSPVRANVYLHAFDRAFLAYCRAPGLAARLVRYGADFVSLMRGGVTETRREVAQRVGRMELKLNEEKSRVVDARKGSFDFRGVTFGRKRSLRTGKVISLVEPARKAQQHFRDEVRTLTGRGSHSRPQGEVVERVKRYGRGGVNYFPLHNSTRAFARQRFCLEQRRRKYLRTRRQNKGFG